MVVQCHIDRVDIVEIGFEIVDKGSFRHARQTLGLYFAPVGTAVFRDVKQAVVCARIKELLVEGRGGQRCDGIVLRHGVDVPGIVPAVLSAHDGKSHALFIARQILRNRSPAVSPIIRAPDAIGGKIQALGVVWIDFDGRIPIVAFVGFAGARLRLNRGLFAGSSIDSIEPTLLRFGVDDIGVARLSGRVVPIGKERVLPIAVRDALTFVCAGWAAIRTIVLGAAIDIVEGLGIIDGYFVVLHDGQIIEETPTFHMVVSRIKPAIAAKENKVGIIRSKGHGVIIHVFIAGIYAFKVCAVIFRDQRVIAHENNFAFVVR